MIISRITGGLGNQMFQYALGRVLAEKNHDILKLDISFYDIFQKVDAPRFFDLDIFKAKIKVATRSECLRFSDSNPVITILNKYFHTNINPHPVTYVSEKSQKYDPEIMRRHGDIYLDGFWQCENYFKDYRSTILEDFTFINMPNKRNQLVLNMIDSKNSISIHVRRGDYVSNAATNKYHGLCDLGYYKKSIDYISKRVESPVYYIFSDDISWCKINLKIKGNVTYISHNNGDNSWEDMRLMSRCKHNIIANSSFSWWAAWLNTNLDKIVIAPRNWYKDLPRNMTDIIPSSWLRL